MVSVVLCVIADRIYLFEFYSVGFRAVNLYRVNLTMLLTNVQVL